MTARNAPFTTIRISWHSQSKQFRKYVGFYLDEKGQRKPKCWYLGSNEKAALNLALRKKAEWQRLVERGHDAWPSPKRHVRRKPIRITVEKAATMYLESMRRRAESSQISWSYFEGEETYIDRVVTIISPSTSIRSIKETDLERAVAAIASRPLVRPRPGQVEGLDKQISAQTAANTVKAMRRLFRWIDEHEQVSWTRPKRFDSILRIRRQHLLTEEERLQEHQQLAAKRVDVFSLDEIAEMLKVASHRQALYIILALNCGFTQGELGGLRTYEVHLRGPNPFIHRRRDKTGIECRWALWPETVCLFRAEIALQNPHQRALLDEKGRPILERNGKTRRDCVVAEWKVLSQSLGHPHRLSFKYLRKTGADMIKQIGGLEISELYLSHRESAPMNAHYANRRWDALAESLDEMRTRLLPSFGTWALRRSK